MQTHRSLNALQGGALKAGTRVAIIPSRQAGTVKAVEAGGAGLPFACAGDSVDLSLNGVDMQVFFIWKTNVITGSAGGALRLRRRQRRPQPMASTRRCASERGLTDYASLYRV